MLQAYNIHLRTAWRPMQCVLHSPAQSTTSLWFAVGSQADQN
jgi:hypothetical protein